MTETATVATTATPAAPAGATTAAATTPAAAAVTPAAVTPAAAAATTVSTPGAVVTPAASATAAAGTSILDGTTTAAAAATAPAAGAGHTPEQLAEAQRIVDAARLAAQPNSGAAWVLTEGVLGTGEKPAWFKSDKYSTVSAQAQAYVELEKRFGGFTGAPKDGKYALPDPAADGFQIDNADHPVFQEFNKLAAELQMSQPAYNKVLGLMAKFEDEQTKNHQAALAAALPNVATEKAKLGANADARIQAVATWAKGNLDEAGYQQLRTATAGTQMAAIFQVLERVIAKSGGVKLPAPGADTAAGASVSGLADIREMQGKKNAQGQRLYDIDPTYRKTVQDAYNAHYAANPTQRDRMGNVRG